MPQAGEESWAERRSPARSIPRRRRTLPVGPTRPDVTSQAYVRSWGVTLRAGLRSWGGLRRWGGLRPDRWWHRRSGGDWLPRGRSRTPRPFGASWVHPWVRGVPRRGPRPCPTAPGHPAGPLGCQSRSQESQRRPLEPLGRSPGPYGPARLPQRRPAEPHHQPESPRPIPQASPYGPGAGPADPRYATRWQWRPPGPQGEGPPPPRPRGTNPLPGHLSCSSP